jgi:23S rRNA (cytosine1962-C5)-methyltransferase
MTVLNYRKIRLKPLKERSLLNRHPWVFSGAIATGTNDFTDGDLVTVYDSSNQFLGTGHFNPGSIRVRILSFEERDIDSVFWKERLSNAYELRKTLGLAGSSHTNTYRLVHGEGDQLPGLVIDIYNNTAVIQPHSKGMQLSLNQIATALTEIEGLRLDNIFSRSSDNHASNESFHLGSANEGTVRENNHLFHVNWKEGQKTGFFLDQRDNRKLLAHYAGGKNVLNTFCYSGGFSIYALKAGAKKVVSVDSSAKAIDWTNINVGMNFPEGAHHESRCDDVFDYLKSANPGEFDIIILDPPAFAKHLSAVDKAVIGYRNLNELGISLVKPGGLIFTFSCSQVIDSLLFRKTIFKAAARTGREVRVIHQISQGPDHPINIYHPEGEYLKGLVLEVR